jgi:hypothetical protein
MASEVLSLDAQLLMGRKTPAIFDRYHIVDTTDLQEGSQRLTGLINMARVKRGVKLALVSGSRARRNR